MNESYDILWAIVPTVLLPLTFVSVALSVVATFIAGLFGIKLKADGPKKLLEVLLKPKVLITALVLNLAGWGAYEGYLYVTNMAALISTIERGNPPSAGLADTYQDHVGHRTVYPNLQGPKAKLKAVELAWQTKLGGGAFRAGAVSEDAVFFGTTDKHVYELDARSGRVVRDFYLGTKVSPAPMIWQNQLVLGEGTHHTHHARIYFFDLKTGTYLRSYQTKGHTEGQPAIASFKGQTLMFVVSGSDGLHAVDPITLERIWHRNDGHVDASARVAGGLVFSGTGRERGDAKKFRAYAVAYEFATGDHRWKRELPASSWMKPIVSGEQVCFVLGEVYFPSEFGAVSCFDQTTGEPSDQYRFLSPVVSRPVAVGSSIFVADLAGNVCRLDMESKRKAWCHSSGSNGKSYTGVTYDESHGVLLYPSVDRGLFVLDPISGAELHHYFPEGWSNLYAGVTIASGHWILAHRDGTMRALKPRFETGYAH